LLKKERKIIWLIAATAGLCVIGVWFFGLLQGLENKSLDVRFALRGPASHARNIAIIVIDDASIKKLGRWPWRRDVHGKMVHVLKAAGAKAIVFDVLFTEADQEHLASDQQFGKEIAAAGNVVVGAFFQKVTDAGVPTDLTAPIPEVRSPAAIGFVNYYPETDGLTRKAPLMELSDSTQVPSLALAGLAVDMGTTPEKIIKEKKIALDENHEIMINFAGGFKTFPYYSYHAVIDGSVDPDVFKDKIVLIGGTATSLFDLKAVSFSQVFPGVEIHATVMSNIIQNDYLRLLPLWVTLLVILVFALAPAGIISRISPLPAGLITIGLFFSYFYGVYLLFSRRFVAVEFVAPMLGLTVSYIGILVYRFTAVDKEKRWIKKTFSHYLSAHVMESILSDPTRLKLGGQRETLTILFSDIRGFTTISESISPEEVVELLNEYLSVMVDIVFKYDGTLDKFIGDAVMAFWGAPVAQADHARKAVLCAIEMIEELKKLQEKWRVEGKKVIDIGIGINTGEMIVGNMGSKEKMEYTVIGDNVNLGSRLEGLTKEYKTHIIVSATTYHAVQDNVEAKPLGSVKVKGKENTVDIYEVVGRKK
jgi:adenylate cyclase